MIQQPTRSPAVPALLFAADHGLGRAGIALGDGAIPPVIWPAAGLGMAALILLGRRMWPAILSGAFVVHAEATGQIGPSLVVALGETAQAMAGAALIDRAAGPNIFRRTDAVFTFAAVCAVVTIIGGTVLAAVRTVAGHNTLVELPMIWAVSWLGHLAGALMLAPAVSLWAIGPFRPMGWVRLATGLLMLATTAAIGAMVFGGQLPPGARDSPVQFICIPLLLWAAVSFGRRETAVVVLQLGGLAIWGTVQGYGPFVRDNLHESFVLVQAYVGVLAITGLVLASAIASTAMPRTSCAGSPSRYPLTGLANYRRLLEVLRTEIARSHRTLRPFAVLFLDMDGLKAINDRYGHLVGSRALTRVADAMAASVRVTDTPARFGGDEFAVVLPETGEAAAEVVLRRISDHLAADPARPALSVSGGVAVFPRDGDSPTQLLRVADKLLYEAKARKQAAGAAASADDPTLSRVSGEDS